MRLPLVARAGLLAEIGALLDGARSGRGAFLLVTGEPGVGKSRLAEETAVLAADFLVVRAWCTPGGALRPWSRLARALAAESGASAAIRRSPRLTALAAIGDPAPEHPDPETDRWLLSLDLADLIAAAAADRPLLVLLDDLHDADPSSLRLLAELAPSLRSIPAVVLATARDGDLDWHGRHEVWGALNRLGETVRPRPFDEADVAELLRAAGAGDGAAAQVITERTGGNPLLVCELVAAGADQAELGRVVPGSVRAITAARLATLPDDVQRVLRVAAALGTEFRLDVLAEVAEVPLGAAVGQAREAGLIDAAEPGAARFRHDLIRDAVYATTPLPQRSQLHGRAAAVLARMAERGRDLDAAEIAGHLLLAGPDSLGAAAEVAARAGDQAMRRLAFEDAVQWYGHVQRCLAVRGAGAAERAGAAIALGDARLATGDPAGARADLLHAAELATRAGRPDLLATAALGFSGGAAGFEVGLLDQEQIGLLERARAALGDDEPALAAQVTARLSIALTLLDSDARRLQLARSAVDTARRCGDDVALAGALAAECDALAGPDHCAVRRAMAGEIVDTAQRLHDPVLELLGRRLRLVALLETGATAEADAEVQAYRATAAALRHPLYLWFVPLWQGMRALADGRFADCRAALDEAAALGAAAGSENATMLVATQRWCLLSALADRQALTDMLAEFDTVPIPGFWPSVTRALVLAQVGRLADARAQLDVAAPLLPSMPRDSEWLASMAQVAEAVGLVGPHPAAAWTYEALTPYAELFAVEGIGAAVRGPVHRSLEKLAAAQGNREQAVEHAAAAVAAERRAGIPQPREPVATDSVFRLDGEYWTIGYLGVRNQLKDSKGLRDLGVLLGRPGMAVAALDLATAVSGDRRSEPGVRHPPSDTGDVVDATARAAYKRRLRELDDEASEADAAGDAERTARVAVEHEALIAALTEAYGLGGRVRRGGSSAERARTAVTARIRDAIRRITRADPVLGEHLRRSVRTGAFCVYDPAAPVHWSVT